MSGETFGSMLRRFRTSRVGRVKANRYGSEHCILSQNELAQRAEIDPAYVNRLEMERPTGRRSEPSLPSRAVVESLSRALHLSPIDRDRMLIAAGYWPWPDQAEDVELALAIVHGALEGERRSSRC